MDRERRGGWVYIIADRYRGTMYVGVASDLPARIHQHRTSTGSDFCARSGLDRLVWAERGDSIGACIAHEKRIKRWRREWKLTFGFVVRNWLVCCPWLRLTASQELPVCFKAIGSTR